MRCRRCSSQSQILVRNGVFGGYGRALTQNDGRTPRKLVDEDRTAVGRVRMQVGRGSRCYPIRIACISREIESRSSFWHHRPTAGYARHFTHTAARACSPTIPTTTPTSGPRGAARARARGFARARRERRGGGVGQRRQRPRRRHRRPRRRRRRAAAAGADIGRMANLACHRPRATM